MAKVDYKLRKNSPSQSQLAFRSFWDSAHPDNKVTDNSYWLVGRLLVSYYERNNPSQILYRMFNSRKEFGFWAERCRYNVRLLTIKEEILYPNETEDACSFCKW